MNLERDFRLIETQDPLSEYLRNGGHYRIHIDSPLRKELINLFDSLRGRGPNLSLRLVRENLPIWSKGQIYAELNSNTTNNSQDINKIPKGIDPTFNLYTPDMIDGFSQYFSPRYFQWLFSTPTSVGMAVVSESGVWIMTKTIDYDDRIVLERRLSIFTIPPHLTKHKELQVIPEKDQRTFNLVIARLARLQSLWLPAGSNKLQEIR